MLRGRMPTPCVSAAVPLPLTVQADRPLTLPPEYGTPVRFRRLFNPVGGFQSVVLTLPAEHPFTVTLKIGDKE